MSDPRPDKARISVFERATRSSSICAEISIDDVLHVRPSWTRQQAAEFLDRNSTAIGQTMLLGGLATLQRLLDGGDEYVQ